MLRFFGKVLVLSLLVILSLSVILNRYGPYIDYFYGKFTTPKQYSLITGDSRAFQSISPYVLDSCLRETNFKLPTYNFAFTISQISYGPSYLSSIKRKLCKDSGDQLFIVTVNPWVLSNRDPELDDESDHAFKNMPPNNMRFTSMKPNAEYVIKNFKYFHFKSLFNKRSWLCKNGLYVDMNYPPDVRTSQEWKSKQVAMLKQFAEDWEPSRYRLEWLSKTISYLNKYGTVFLVRTPLEPELLMVENDYWIGFDTDMEIAAKLNDICYFNYSQCNKWNTYDGQHLYPNDVIGFTKELSKDIMESYLKKVISYK